jgi:predicted site-specific integrase-resolvase
MARIEPRYTISHLAVLADQSYDTIDRRIKDGMIHTVKLLDGSKRIPESEVLRYLCIEPEPETGDAYSGNEQ